MIVPVKRMCVLNKISGMYLDNGSSKVCIVVFKQTIFT